MRLWIWSILLLGLAGVGLYLGPDYSGDFSISDDWAYSTPIRWWHEFGEIKLTHWQSMPLISQLFVGIVWTNIFEFSQENLRELTLFLGLVSCFLVYSICRLVNVSFFPAVMCSFLPLSSPLFVGLSYTFMTDIPSASAGLLVVYLYLRHLKEDALFSRYFWVGGLALVGAILLRQSNLGLSLAVLFALPLARGIQFKSLLPGAIVLVFSLAAYFGFNAYLQSTTGLPLLYSVKSSGLFDFLSDVLTGEFGALKQSLRAILKGLVQLGLYLLPIAPISIYFNRRNSLTRWGIFISFTMALVSAAYVMGAAAFSGTVGDILTTDGIGPRLIGTGGANWVIGSILLTSIGLFVTVLSFVASLEIFTKKKKVGLHLLLRNHADLAFLVLAAALVYLPHVISYGPLFDRYSVFPALLLSIVLFRFHGTKVIARSVNVLTVSILGLFYASTLFLVQDFFQWQDARYKLINVLIEMDGYSPDQIDGGFEYINLAAVLSDPDMAISMKLESGRDRKVQLVKEVWDSDEVIQKITYQSLLGLRTTTVYAINGTDANSQP